MGRVFLHLRGEIKMKEEVREGSLMAGRLKIDLIDRVSGEVAEHYEYRNNIVDVGQTQIAKLLASGSSGTNVLQCRYMSVGTGTTAEADSDTALGGELTGQMNGQAAGTRNATTNTLVTTTDTQDTCKFESTWTGNDGTGAVTEIGLYTASPSGATNDILIARRQFPVINKDSSYDLTVDWRIQFTT